MLAPPGCVPALQATPIAYPMSRFHRLLRVTDEDVRAPDLEPVPKQGGNYMSQKPIPFILRLFPLCVLIVVGTASGQMIPLEDLRQDGVHVFYQTTGEDYQSHLPPTPFAYFEDQCTGVAETYEPCENPPPDQCLIGQCTGLAFQYSEFFPAGIQFSGGTSASWGLPPSGLWSLQSASGFKFKVDTAFDYNLFIVVDPGDSEFDGSNGGSVSLLAYYSGGSTFLREVVNGQLQVSGRLGPGTYKLTGLSAKVGTLDTYQGLTYFAQWTVQQPPQPAVAIQPSDHSVACGGTVVFSVGTATAQSNYTFQWRKNFVPLVNGPGVTGATTSTLTLTNVCSAGDYDVVVTGPNPAGGGTIAEPSRLAHLSIVTPTAVESQPTNPAATVVRAPAPNPFRASTSIAYDVRQPARLNATVYNASGAKVRSLDDRTVSGPGTVTWDGRLHSGARAPVGIYFLRVELGDVRETRKVVLLQ